MSLRIISWDVGISHLAYCILDDDGDGNISIIDWDEIDLIEDDRVKETCCGKTVKGGSCGKRIKYVVNTSDGRTKGFCETHKDQSKKYVDVDKLEEEFMLSEYTDGEGCEFFQKKSQKNCGKCAKFISKDRTRFCTTHYKSELSKYIKTHSLQTQKKVSTSDFSTSDLQLKLVEKLDSLINRFAYWNISEVVIENQPAFKNPRMKSIASTLFDYFLIRGYVDRKDNFDINIVRFLSPCNKLKVNENNTLEVFKNTKKDNKYKITKELGIKYTKQLLQDKQPELIEYLEIYKKKDDLCDAFLQGRYYLDIYRRNNVPKQIKKSSSKTSVEKVKSDKKSKTGKKSGDISVTIKRREKKKVIKL